MKKKHSFKKLIPIIWILGMDLFCKVAIGVNDNEWITVNVDLTIEQQS